MNPPELPDPTATVPTRTTTEPAPPTRRGAVCNPRFRPRRLRRAGENPDAIRLGHGVEGACELACTIRDQELDWSCAPLVVHKKLRAACVVHIAAGIGGDAGQVDAAVPCSMTIRA